MAPRWTPLVVALILALVALAAAGGAVATDAATADRESPQISEVIEPDHLVVGERNATQRMRLILLDLPTDAPVTVRVNLTPLVDAGASLADATATARADLGAELRGVERNGSTVAVRARTGSGERVAVELAVRGIDTRKADPTTGLRYAITLEEPAGTATDETEPFGLYPPGGTPTPTPTPVTDGTATATPDGTDGTGATAADGSGFGPLTVATATAFAVVIALRRRRS